MRPSGLSYVKAFAACIFRCPLGCASYNVKCIRSSLPGFLRSCFPTPIKMLQHCSALNVGNVKKWPQLLYSISLFHTVDVHHCITMASYFIRQQTNESSDAVIPMLVWGWIAGLKCVGSSDWKSEAAQQSCEATTFNSQAFQGQRTLGWIVSF